MIGRTTDGSPLIHICVTVRGVTPSILAYSAVVMTWPDVKSPGGQAFRTLGVPKVDLQEHDGVPRLVRAYRVKTFRDAVALTNAIADLAEAEGHHPALLTEWGKVTVSWWTHKIRGLHRNDFIMAAKTDARVAECYPSGNEATTS